MRFQENSDSGEKRALLPKRNWNPKASLISELGEEKRIWCLMTYWGEEEGVHEQWLLWGGKRAKGARHGEEEGVGSNWRIRSQKKKNNGGTTEKQRGEALEAVRQRRGLKAWVRGRK